MRKDVPLKFVKYKEGTKYRDPDFGLDEYNDNADSYWDAGLMIDDNTVVIDIDLEGNKPHDLINKIIEEFGIETQVVYTDRGAHFYFDKPKNYTHKANFVSKLGLKMEAKRATAKHRSVTVKRKGKLRKISNAGIYQDLPEIFTPIVKNPQKSPFDPEKLNMMNLVRGGRNDAVFNFRRAIANVDDADKITMFANRYLIEDPMEDKEVMSICASARNYVLQDDESSEEYRITETIIDELRTVVHNDTLYMLENEDPARWTADKAVIQRTIFQEYCKGKTHNFFSGVYRSVRTNSPVKPKDAIFPVRFRNGIIEDGEFWPGDNTTFTPYMIDINYDPDAPAVKVVDDYLAHLTNNDPSYRALIEEIMGHTLITNHEVKRTLGKFFIFIGGGGNGKGTFLEILSGILGRDNVSNLSPDQMVQESQSNTMIGKLANLGDDIEDSALDDKKMKILKNISTCDTIQLRHLRHDGFQAQLTCTLIFTSNHVIKSWEKGDSYKRRVQWLPMFSKVGKKDPKFITKLTSPEALAYWAKLMVEGYMRLYSGQGFTECEAVNEYNKQYHEDNDNTIEYCRESGEEMFIDQTLGDIYTAYEVWCQSQMYNPLSAKKLKEQLLVQFNLMNDKTRSIKGIKAKFFYKKED